MKFISDWESEYLRAMAVIDDLVDMYKNQGKQLAKAVADNAKLEKANKELLDNFNALNDITNAVFALERKLESQTVKPYNFPEFKREAL